MPLVVRLMASIAMLLCDIMTCSLSVTTSIAVFIFRLRLATYTSSAEAIKALSRVVFTFSDVLFSSYFKVSVVLGE